MNAPTHPDLDPGWARDGLELDARFWPIFIERFPSSWPAPEVAAAWLQRSARFAERGPFVAIIDALDVRRPAPADERKRISRFLLEDSPFNQNCMAIVMIFRGPIVRGAVTALSWVTPRRQPWHTVGDWPAAIARAEVTLSTAGVEAGDALERLRRLGGVRNTTDA